MTLFDAEVLPEFGGWGPSDRRAWFALRLRAVSGEAHCDIDGSRGVSVATVPHYAVPRELADGRSAASVTLGQAGGSEEIVVPFELAWDVGFGEGEHRVALVAVRIGAPGATEVAEVPVRLRVGAARGAMDRRVTRAVCEAMAGRALHLAARGEDSAEQSARLLADAAGWICGRASVAGLDPLVDLGPMLRALAAVQAYFEAGPKRT